MEAVSCIKEGKKRRVKKVVRVFGRNIGQILRIHCKNSVFGGLSLKDYIEERAVEIATYIIETKATVRQTAKKFGISKSTVHKDVTDRLLQINPGLAQEARKVLDVNKQERHIRGGLATKEKYLHKNPGILVRE